jgi:hypothetical protein
MYTTCCEAKNNYISWPLTIPLKPMQINFWMGDNDRALFHDYIFSRNGYLTPENWKDTAIPIASVENKIDIDYFLLKIYKEELFPKSNFNDPDWFTFNTASQLYLVSGPGMEYMRSYTKNGEMIKGRIYMGTVGPSSFTKPGSSVSEYAKYEEAYKKLENFYRSCCRFIREHFRNAGHVYCGPHSDQLVKEGMVRVSFPGTRPVDV